MKPFELADEELPDAVKKELQEVNKEDTSDVAETGEFETEGVKKEELKDVNELPLKIATCNVSEDCAVGGNALKPVENGGLTKKEADPREKDTHTDIPTESIKTEMEEEEERVCNYYQIQKLLGSGGFGKVYLVSVINSGMLFAMKVMDKTECGTSEARKQRVHEEAEIQRMLESPFIVELYAVFATANRVFFVLEYVDFCSLAELVRRHEKLTPDTARFYMAEILAALKYLKQLGVAHRDLKCENVVLQNTGHIKICDFGLAKKNMFLGAKASSPCGTYVYMAPEVQEQSYTRLSDIWSYGIMCVKMLTGTVPTGNKKEAEEVKEFLRNFPFPYKMDLPGHPAAVDFVEKILRPEEARFDVEDLQQHEFFSEISWDMVETLQLTPPITKPENDQNQPEARKLPLHPCEVFDGYDRFANFYWKSRGIDLWINNESRERAKTSKFVSRSTSPMPSSSTIQ